MEIQSVEINRNGKAVEARGKSPIYERYQTIYLHAVKQMSVFEIAEIILRNPVTVSTYIKSYQNKGLDGLVMGVSTGAPEQLTTTQADYHHESSA